MALAERDAIVADLMIVADPQSQLQYLIDLSKELEPLSEDERQDKYKIDGCLSQLWLVPSLEDGIVYFKADSDAIIPKGIAAVLVKTYSGLTPQEIIDNPADFISDAGIDKHLSINRRNGLANLLNQIQNYAIAYKAISDAS